MLSGLPEKRWMLSLRAAIAVGAAVVLGALAVVLLTRGSAVAYDLDRNNCLSCHSNPEMSTRNGNGTTISLYVNTADFVASAHKYTDCSTCHTAEPHQQSTPLTKLSLARKCGTCHQYEYEQHLTSIHGQQLQIGNQDVATCVDCHSVNSNPHSIVRVLETSASTYPKNVAATCAKCHDDSELMAKYGIVEKVYESYMRSFHGKATMLSPDISAQLNKATCVSCHGTHDIKAVSDPNAPVAGMANLAKTCEQCHPGAGVRFAGSFLGHKEADPDYYPTVYWGERFFLILTAVVLSMGAGLVSLEILRWLVGRIRGEKQEHNA